MKILLVQSYLGRNEPGGAVFPIGLCCIASMLDGHDIEILDLNLYQSPLEELKSRLGSSKYDVVGVSLRNIDTTQKKDPYYYFLTLGPTFQSIRRAAPQAVTMIGGAGFSMFAQRIMERIPEIDFGVYLEGDETVPELLANLDSPEKVRGIFIRNGQSVAFTGPRDMPDISKLPMPRRDYVDISRYNDPVYTNIGVQTKRGCTLRCAYCNYPFLNGRKIRIRTPSQVVDEIEYLTRDLKMGRFMFVDSSFNIPEGHAESICREIIKRGIQTRWAAWYDLGRFDQQLLDLALKAGCINFSFSPDAASDSSLAALQKDTSEKDIARIIGMFQKVRGVRVEMNCFCTPPGQDFSGFLKTLKLFFDVHFKLFGKGVLNFGWVRVEPHTVMHRIAVREGILSEDSDLLPLDGSGLPDLFYSCPKTGCYADPIFSILLNSKKKLKPLLKRFLAGRHIFNNRRGREWEDT